MISALKRIQVSLPFGLVQSDTSKSFINPFCPMESVKLGPLCDAVGIVEPFSQLAKFDGFDKICCILDISNGVNDFVFVEKIVVFVVKVLLENVKFKPFSHVI